MRGEFGEPFGVAVRDGQIYVSDGERGRIFKVDNVTGAVADFAEGLHTPSGIAFDQDGNLIVADTGSHTIRKVSPQGQITEVAGIAGKYGFADGPVSSALLNGPIGVAVGPDGQIFVSDTYNDRIRVIINGQVTTLAGSRRGYADGTGGAALFDTPLGVALTAAGTLLVADLGNSRIRVVEPSGQTSTLTGSGPGPSRDGTLASAVWESPTAVTVAQSGSVFVVDGAAIRAIGRRALPLVETISSGDHRLTNGPALTAPFNRPSGIAVDATGNLIIADSGDQLIRAIGDSPPSGEISPGQLREIGPSAEEFRSLQPARWPFDPPDAKREIAGTLGEIRGDLPASDTAKPVWFHNGLDVAGSYGETVRLVRSETVLEPVSVANLGGLRELIRMPSLGYVHIRVGRDKNDHPFDDARFQFERDPVTGELVNLRVPRGTVFRAGEPLGTLNAFNHVHLIAGRAGSEMNAIAALELPGLSDSIAPVIERVDLTDENWRLLDPRINGGRVILTAKTRVVVRAYDRVDGNAERRRLGVYRLGYQIFRDDGTPLSPEIDWTIRFDRMPPHEAVRLVYAPGSRSGYTPDTVFNYIVTNRVNGDDFAESSLDPAALGGGKYTLRVFAADFFGNTASKDISIEVAR